MFYSFSFFDKFLNSVNDENNLAINRKYPGDLSKIVHL
jgi:hypothetical protein